jgi:hypothetical protein
MPMARLKSRRQAIGPMGLNRFAAMQHKTHIRLGHGTIKQSIVQCTKIHGGIAGPATTTPLTQGVARKPFNFCRFHADSDWTGAAAKT